ncbi:MAG: alanine--tRNA ligase [Armatimonadota bacterium]|nr:alanine--tRNA ligase [Armatimonadota bacterium]MDW8026117.1 alanine--tRNA ligase [Armatimonadota bacterium]
MTGHELRRAFLDFFKGKDHLVLPSYPLIPDDPSTLFTSAGMQPFVPYFKGERKPPHARISTCQKCTRTGDIDRVGYTWRHLTFFEMLGNFSFGDYFKKEAIIWAWEFLTDVLRIPCERLWVSVYLEDDEAFEIWQREVGLPEERIVRLGKSDNWWGPVGDEGPCGPCTEIHYDRGIEYGCGRADCKPGCDCDRWGELWNLVFQQYDQQRDGTLVPLPKPGIDTGMGLERLAAVMQGKETIFETDLFWAAVERVIEMLNGSYRYGEDTEVDAAVRIIADHSRAATFVIADGVVPSNEGRGYVLRRFIRRAYIYGKRLGINGEFVHRLAQVYADIMREPYPEVAEQLRLIEDVIRREEERFSETMERGLQMLEEIIERQYQIGEPIISGEDAFKLYDTYGFPIELTQEVARSRGFDVDIDGFNAALERQRELARARSAFRVESAEEFEGITPTKFVGYETTRAKATVVAVRQINDDVWVALDRTPFYAEAGGQVADVGWLRDDEGLIEVDVTDAQWRGDVVAHKVIVRKGMLAEGMVINAIVDEARRNAIRRAHTATHLLHAALRRVLGEHARQAGSLVAPDRLRFDFTHGQALTDDEVAKVEALVNEFVLSDIKVETIETELQEARQMGALALFGEKYGERVRVVRISNVSMELCGGTHLDRTSQVGFFKLISEVSVAANVRRIDALTGFEAFKWVRQREELLSDISEMLETPPDRLRESISALLEERRNLQKRIEQLEARAAAKHVDELLKEAITVSGVRLVAKSIPNMSIAALGQLADALVARLPSGVAVLASVVGGRVLFVAKVSPEAKARGVHAGELLREVASVTGGGGGGRADFAQAGGKDPTKLDEALAKAKEVVEMQVKG